MLTDTSVDHQTNPQLKPAIVKRNPFSSLRETASDKNRKMFHFKVPFYKNVLGY